MYTKIDATPLASSFTQANLYTALKAAMISAGFSTPYDDFVSGSNNVIVYQEVVNGSAKGTLYIAVTITPTTIQCVHWASWNAGTHVGTTSLVTGGSYTYSNANALNFYSFQSNGGEGRFIIANQTTTWSPMTGWIRPTGKPSWYNEATYRYTAICQNTTWSSLTMALDSYLGTASVTLSNEGFTTATGANAADSNNRQLMYPRHLCATATKQGYYGDLSNDFVLIAPSGVAVGDMYRPIPGTEEYFVLSVTNPGFTAIRTV